MACARSVTCSLVSTLETLLRTVFGERYSAAAICALDRPAATRSSTSRSRAVSCGNAVAGPAGPAGEKTAVPPGGARPDTPPPAAPRGVGPPTPPPAAALGREAPAPTRAAAENV